MTQNHLITQNEEKQNQINENFPVPLDSVDFATLVFVLSAVPTKSFQQVIQNIAQVIYYYFF